MKHKKLMIVVILLVLVLSGYFYLTHKRNKYVIQSCEKVSEEWKTKDITDSWMKKDTYEYDPSKKKEILATNTLKCGMNQQIIDQLRNKYNIHYQEDKEYESTALIVADVNRYSKLSCRAQLSKYKITVKEQRLFHTTIYKGYLYIPIENKRYVEVIYES